MHDDGTTVSDIYIYDEDTGGENYDPFNCYRRKLRESMDQRR